MNALRRRRSGAGSYVWGFADQALVSGTNLGLSLLAGRVLGPAGLGVVFLGFTGYALGLSFQRALVTTPLVASSATLPRDDRDDRTRAALGVVLLFATGTAATFALLGLALDGAVGHGLLVFAPWVAAALVQDFWRVILFRDERPRAVAVNDGVWLGVALVGAVVASRLDTDWAVVGAWGAGAVVAASIGFVQFSTGVLSPRRSLAWWRAEAWAFGRWLALHETLYSIASYLLAVVLAAAAGARALGGLRAAETLFAPFSLIGPALTLPGLPAMTRAQRASPASARRLTLWLTIAPGALTAAYLALMLVVGERVLELLYGAEFASFAKLIFPLGIWQLALALGIGLTIALKAQRRGTEIVVAGAIGSLVTVVTMSALTIAFDIFVGAWGLAAGAAAATLASAFFVASGMTFARRPLSVAPSDGAQ
jgi:O-antigen/teichoic acid export membrane protein